MSDATVPPVASRSALNAINMTSSLLPEGEYEFSPLMLSSAYTRIARLLFMVFCSVFGSTMNGYFIASFFVETSLQNAGNTYLACVGLSDLLLTFGVMPVSAVVLLSGQWDNVHVCRAVHIIGQTATYAYSLFFMMIGLESYFRICGTKAAYQFFLSLRVTCMSFLICGLSIALSVAGVLLDLDYDYCERKFYGNLFFRIATMVLLHVIPAVVTFALLIACKRKIKKRMRREKAYKRSRSYKNEYSTTSMNITAYALFILAWLPSLVIVFEFPGTGDKNYYYTVWFGLFRSVFTSFLYGIVNRTFRRAFAYVFNYCCCKSTLPGPCTCRHPHNYTRTHRPLERKLATGYVRVHALQMIASGYPHRDAATSCETQNL